MSKKKKTAVLIEVFLFSVAVVWVIPVISTMQVSLKNSGFQNYKDVFSTRINDVLILPKMILNSFIITGRDNHDCYDIGISCGICIF